MSGKTKKTTTTGEKNHANVGDTSNISLTSSKIIKKLSISFYGDTIMKQQKQIIWAIKFPALSLSLLQFMRTIHMQKPSLSVSAIRSGYHGYRIVK